MELREQVLQFVMSQNYAAMGLERLQTHFDQPIEATLQSLCAEGLLVKGKYNDYFVPAKMGLKRARIKRVRAHNAFASLIDETGDIYIDDRDMKDALIEDYVLLSILKGTTQGIVFKVYRRGTPTIVGEFVNDRIPYVIPDDPQFTSKIVIKKKETLGAVDGHKVLVTIEEYRSEYVLGKIDQILGHKNDPGVDIQSVVVRHHVPYQFSPELLASLNSVPDHVLETELANRTDYRQNLIVTIDGEDAKDFDDAVHAKKLENGNYQVGVHIADVAYYVTPQSLLDQEALTRGTSLYLVDRVIPMLPHQLSNGICSLNPQVDRLCLTCLMEVNDKGKVVHYEIHPSVIHSKARLTYTQVNGLLEQQTSIKSDIDALIKDLHTVSLWVRKDRESRGGLDLDVNEAKVIVKANGEPIDVILRHRGEGERLIEDLMILANETVASHVYWLTKPFIYRVHAQPKAKKLETLASLIAPLGYRLKKEVNGLHPHEIQHLLKRSEGKAEHDVIAKLVLRSLAKAEYTTQNIGHFGLASECYTHFTSPIRRYPDLMVHRLLRRYQTATDDLNENEALHLEMVAENSSFTERRAVEVEREVEDMKKAEYMSHHIDEIFDGVVSGFITTGFFVELDNTVEGLVRFATLDDDFYVYDEESMVARGSSTKRLIYLGDRMKVKVKSADKYSGQVDFVIVKNPSIKRK